MWRWLGALALVLAVVAAIVWRSAGDGAVGTESSPAADAGNDSQSKAIARQGGGEGSRSADQNLVEIDVMGGRMDVSRLFQLGFGGGLVLDQEARAALDTLLVQLGDLTPEDQRKLDYTLRQGMPKEEAERALKMFEGYRSYQAELRTEAPNLGIPETAAAVDDYFARVAQVQRRHFDDATASALFGQEMRNARLVLLAATVERNAALTAEQKKTELEALRAQLPADQRHLIPEPSSGAASEAK